MPSGHLYQCPRLKKGVRCTLQTGLSPESTESSPSQCAHKKLPLKPILVSLMFRGDEVVVFNLLLSP